MNQGIGSQSISGRDSNEHMVLSYSISVKLNYPQPIILGFVLLIVTVIL